MNTYIRKAVVDDIPRMVDLSEQKRIQYQEYQPVFWRKAQNSLEMQKPFFEMQITNNDVIALVYAKQNEIQGFVIANARSKKECNIDDFCVANASEWSIVGKALMEAVGYQAQERGVTNYLVVCGHLDQPKRAMLLDFGLSLDRYWYTAPIERNMIQETRKEIRLASAADASQMSRLSQQERTSYPEIGKDNTIVLVYDENKTIRGYAIAIVIPTPPVYDPGGLTSLFTEFTVDRPNEWITCGEALLKAVGQESQKRGAVQYVVICTSTDQPKQSMLRKAGLTIASEWYTGKI